MAFRSNGPTMVTLPPFRGVARRIILLAIAAFFAVIVVGMAGEAAVRTLVGHLVLTPGKALPHEPWQMVTYAFMPLGLISLLFSLLSVWFFGSTLEDERGSRWFGEYFLAATVGGGLVAAVLGRVGALGVNPASQTAGLWPSVLAILLAYARFHPEQELRFNFILTLKAKYLAAIYLLLYLAMALVGGDRLGALTALSAAVCGWVYLRYAPRRGVGFAASEGWFGVRNAYYRAKRRRAAKKFTVYMKKQGKDASFDPRSGEYKDPNDKRWMN